jgi:hypothetical protein
MARVPRALMLATVLVAVAGVRAMAQPVPPAPATLPDPAAVLLPPVASDTPPVVDHAVRLSSSESPLPTAEPVRSHQRGREPAARIAFDDGDATRVSAADYDRAVRTSYSDPDSAKRTIDPFEYLNSGGRSSRGLWDSEPKVKGKNDGFFTGLFDRLTGRRNDDALPADLKVVEVDGVKRWWESDRKYANFISPVSNPFFAEDPRTLTEVRPIVLYQKIPNNEGLFRGGNAWFFGGQARLAVGERWSVVVNKVGGQSFNPGRDSLLAGGTGLSELWVGPKFVLLRNPDTQTLVSVGTTFQIPLGSSGVYQDTGKLSIVPYVSAAQRLMGFSWGTFQGMGTAGYSISTTRDRSDFFFASAHLDFDVGNLHRFYPLAELNWFAYTTDGRERPFMASVGRDLANFGGPAKGNNLLTWALGGRFRTKNGLWEVGAAYEGRLFGPRGLFDGRVTVDLIMRF